MKMNFPIWQFLNQPVFDASHKLVLNPRRFWYSHKVHLLERCWTRACEQGNQRS